MKDPTHFIIKNQRTESIRMNAIKTELLDKF